MPEIDRLYVDSCVLIDLAKHKANLTLDANPEGQTAREGDVWRLERLLFASRDKVVKIYTSSLTLAECNHLGDSNPTPDVATQRFFSELLASGKSGIYLVQPSYIIMEKARDLRWRHSIYLSPSDSIHAATALHMGCKEILTLDKDFQKNKDKLAQHKLAVVRPNDTALLPTKYAQDSLFT